jgi:RNase P subunit RPR2
MAKDIFCANCKKPLGTIRDARLRKGIKFLCPECNTKRIASDMAKKPDMELKDLFGGIFAK